MADYDLIVIGAGSGGLTAVQFAADLGARVALVEKHRVGGDCTWTGCVPSKALLHIAKTVHQAKTAVSYGLHLAETQVDMRQVKAQIEQVIDEIYRHETPEQLQKTGIEVIMGSARFVDAHTLRVGKRQISGRFVIVATGAHPLIPPIPGLAAVPYVTYEQIFATDRLPEHLVILGAGPVGVETAQAYRRLGADVTLIDRHVLPAADGEARDVLKQVLQREGVRVMTELVTAVAHNHHEKIVVPVDEQQVVADMLLVAAGRLPNVQGLDLEKAGVAFDAQGISVNNKLQTSTPHIFAVGDCTGGFQFTHYAGWQGFQAARNALLPGSANGVLETVPWTVFTDPEVAQVGLTEAAARLRFGDQVQVMRRPLSRVDRAVTDRADLGFIKVVWRNGRILGATIVAERAGEMINEFAIAIRHNIRMQPFAETMHVYPSYGMGIQRMLAQQATESFLRSRAGKIAAQVSGFTPR